MSNIIKRQGLWGNTFLYRLGNLTFTTSPEVTEHREEGMVSISMGMWISDFDVLPEILKPHMPSKEAYRVVSIFKEVSLAGVRKEKQEDMVQETLKELREQVAQGDLNELCAKYESQCINMAKDIIAQHNKDYERRVQEFFNNMQLTAEVDQCGGEEITAVITAIEATAKALREQKETLRLLRVRHCKLMAAEGGWLNDVDPQVAEWFNKYIEVGFSRPTFSIGE